MAISDSIHGIANGMNSQNELEFILVILAIVFAWTLVELMKRFIENLFYETFLLDRTSAWHALVVLLTVASIFFALVWFLDKTEFLSSTDNLEDIIESSG
jgi:hypothetical protein